MKFKLFLIIGGLSSLLFAPSALWAANNPLTSGSPLPANDPAASVSASAAVCPQALGAGALVALGNAKAITILAQQNRIGDQINYRFERDGNLTHLIATSGLGFKVAEYYQSGSTRWTKRSDGTFASSSESGGLWSIFLNLFINPEGDAANSTRLAPAAGESLSGQCFYVTANTVLILKNRLLSNLTFSAPVLAQMSILYQKPSIQIPTNLTPTPTPLSSGSPSSIASSTGATIAPVVTPTPVVNLGKLGINIIQAPNTVAIDQPATYSVDLVNTGSSILSQISLTSSGCLDFRFKGGDLNVNGQLDPGEAWQYDCQVTFTLGQVGIIPIIITASGHDVTGQTQQQFIQLQTTVTNPNSIPASGGQSTPTNSIPWLLVLVIALLVTAAVVGVILLNRPSGGEILGQVHNDWTDFRSNRAKRQQDKRQAKVRAKKFLAEAEAETKEPDEQIRID